jgi:hypothetical protein
VLQLIPGVYVESTGGPVSNNYSVRGLPTFIALQEDGMPVLYGGGGRDHGGRLHARIKAEIHDTAAKLPTHESFLA